LDNVRPLAFPKPLTNRLAEESAGSLAHTIVKRSLDGAVAAQRRFLKAETELDRVKSEGQLMTYISVVTDAVSFHEAAPIIHSAIVVEKVHDVRKLHRMVCSIEPPPGLAA